MSNFDAEKFADWLQKAFADSPFKTFTELGRKVGLTKATISSYAKATPQTASNKPSRPKRDNVILIAQALKKDVDEALLLTGHSPMNTPQMDESFAGLYKMREKLSAKQKQIVDKQMRSLIEALSEEEHDFDY